MRSMLGAWRPPRPVAVLIIHGTADENVPCNGRVRARALARHHGRPVSSAINTWRAPNGCPDSAATTTAGAVAGQVESIAAYLDASAQGSGCEMPITHNKVDPSKFNAGAELPFELRLKDFEIAMQDVYDFFHDVNVGLTDRGLERLDGMLRPAIMSGLLSDMLTSSVAKHARALTVNLYHNGHPDLVLQGEYAGNAVKAGTKGVEIKTTRKSGGAVDTHGARDQWLCVFVYDVDNSTEPAHDRAPMTFTEVYLGKVTVADFRRNPRGELGTRTATLHREGLEKLRQNWIYKLSE